MKNLTLSHTYLNLPPFTDDLWDDYDPVELLEETTGKVVVEMNTPDDYVYIVFNHPEACELELNFRYLHQARAWLQSADIVSINDQLEIIECPEQDEWLDTLTYLLDTLSNNFQEYHIGGRATLAINCKNPAVDPNLAEYARETLEECNFHIDYQGRSGGYMCLSYWKNTPFSCYGLDSLEKILQLIDQATGNPQLWEAFDDDLTRIVEQVEDFKSWIDEDKQGEWEDEDEILPSTVNSPEMLGEITRDAANYFDLPLQNIEAVYEHGQWWVKLIRSSGIAGVDDLETYSVVDTINGFDYEEV